MVWTRRVGRYRPYLILVVAVAAVALIPSAGDDGDTRVASDRSVTAGTVAAPVGAPAASADGATLTAPVRGAGGAGARTGAVGPGGGAVAPSTRVAGTEFPGIGTPEALANPNCDPATEKIRFPTKFAPDCVRPWPKGADNGGATSMGVTKDSIKIVILDTSDERTRADNRREMTEFMAMLNRHYELWGRKLEIVFFPRSGTDEVAQRADAIQVSNMKPFMAHSYMTFGSASPVVWATELAARGIISWDPSTYFDSTHAQAGFRWGSHDNRLSAVMAGEWVGKRLVGQPARWAGDPTMAAQPRRFGLVYDKEWDRKAFEEVLGRYGAKLADAAEFDTQANPADQQSRASVIIARMKDAGVNNVVNATNLVFNVLLTQTATTQNFTPEWTLTGWGSTDTTIAGQLADQRQWAHAFGQGGVPIQTTDAGGFDYSALYEWEYGHPPGNVALMGQIWQWAKSAVAAIQLAGPNLTPATFQAALFAMAPRGGTFCGCVASIGYAFGRTVSGYPWDKYGANSDAAEKWYDPNAVVTNEVGLTAPGGIRFVNDAKRYTAGTFPTGPPDMFNPANGRFSYDQLPPADRDPSYPSPAP